jgi:hypothetical protein
MLEIRFSTIESGKAFAKLYEENGVSCHEKYKGEVKIEKIRGDTHTAVIYLERAKVVDFRKLGEDIRKFGGRIVL